MLYYALVYALRAKICVCLGSGDGFVPRLLKQAQRDAGVEEARTLLIDGNLGRWGRPNWLPPDSFLKTAFPDIEIFISSTRDAARNLPLELKIDYLHIDADRTPSGALQDFLDYAPLMAKGGLIALHDTGPLMPCASVVAMIEKLGYHAINLDHLGNGVALITIE